MKLMPGLTTALVAVSGPLTAQEALVGHWFWVDHQTLAFSSDGRAEALKDGRRVAAGRWTAKDGGERRYTVLWTQGGPPQELQVSADGWTLMGSTPEGTPQRGERLDSEDAAGSKAP